MRKQSVVSSVTSARRTAAARAVVVVSALSGITDRLLHLAAAAAAADAAGGGRRARRAPAAPRVGCAPGGARVGGPARAHRGRRGRAPQPAARDRHLEGPVAAHSRRGGRLRRAPEQPHRRSGLSGGGTAGGLDRSAARADHQRHLRLCAAVDGRDHRRRDGAPPAAGRGRPRAGDRRVRRRHDVRGDHDARAGAGRTTRRRFSARRSTPARFRSGPTSTA